MNIGIVEDNPSILEVMQTALELAGHTTSTHMQGQSLLNVFLEQDILLEASSFPYDLLIVDLNLPGELSGLEIVNFVYQLFAPDVPPVIVASAADIEQLNSLRHRFPTLPILRKPFAIRTLLQTVSSIQSTGIAQKREIQHPSLLTDNKHL